MLLDRLACFHMTLSPLFSIKVEQKHGSSGRQPKRRARLCVVEFYCDLFNCGSDFTADVSLDFTGTYIYPEIKA